MILTRPECTDGGVPPIIPHYEQIQISTDRAKPLTDAAAAAMAMGTVAASLAVAANPASLFLTVNHGAEGRGGFICVFIVRLAKRPPEHRLLGETDGHGDVELRWTRPLRRRRRSSLDALHDTEGWLTTYHGL